MLAPLRHLFAHARMEHSKVPPLQEDVRLLDQVCTLFERAGASWMQEIVERLTQRSDQQVDGMHPLEDELPLMATALDALHSLELMRHLARPTPKEE